MLSNKYNTSGIAENFESKNKVLRNTYGLLGLSLVPTVLGAWFGVSTGVGLFSLLGGGIISFLVFFAAAFGFIYVIQRNANSMIGVFTLLAFTLFMGWMLTDILTYTLMKEGGAELVMLAFGGTAAIFVSMSFLATVIKKDLSFMGKFLFVGLIMLLVAVVANIFLKITLLSLVISVIAMGIFSAYLVYDTQKIINGGERNYVRATLSIYLDVYNIFVNLLNILNITSK